MESYLNSAVEDWGGCLLLWPLLPGDGSGVAGEAVGGDTCLLLGDGISLSLTQMQHLHFYMSGTTITWQ